MSLPVVIDTDPGIDDALALLLALRSPELVVRAVVTVYGNTTLSHATRNAQVIAQWAGARVPVIAGADRPVSRALEVAIETHGPSGLGEAVVPGAAPVESNPDALLEALTAQPGPVTLVTLGPLTNLAHALRRDAELVHRKVTTHLAMAGSLRARGTATTLSEFNVWCDPEAAAVVLAAALPSRWVGLDVTRRLVMSADDVEGLDQTPRRRWLRDALRQYVRFHRSYEGLDGCVINDPLVIADLVSPGLVTYEKVTVSVDRGEGAGRGRTVLDPAGHDALFAVAADELAAHRLLAERVFNPEDPDAVG